MKLKPSIRTSLSLILVALATAACDSSDPEPPPPPPEPENIRFVDGVNGNDQAGENDCGDPDTPCQTISHAIDVSIGGDVIQIANAEYTETLDIPRSLTLQGESEDGTIIQGHEEPGEATARVITIDGDFEVAIADLTIRHGAAGGGFPDNRGGGLSKRDATLTLTDVTFSRNTATNNGGGMLNSVGSATLTNVTFSDNSAPIGGGMSNGGASPTLTNVVFTENSAGNRGGGMSNGGGSPTLTDVTFSRNTAELFGGGMSNAEGDPTLTNVTFTGNTAGFNGGGMFNNQGGSPTLIDVLFRDNSSAGESTGHGGGGMANSNNSAPELINVVFDGNTASAQGFSLRGGGMRNDNSSPILKNVTFRGNSASTGGGMANIDGSSPHLTNAIFFDNSAQGGGAIANLDSSAELLNVTVSSNQATVGGGIFNSASTAQLDNSIVWGNEAGNGGNEVHNNSGSSASLSFSLFDNDDGDIVAGAGFTCSNCIRTQGPRFVDPANDNLRLQDDSPAIDAGDPQTNPLLFPTDENDNPVDLDGNPRFFGDGDVVDIGAYEFNPNAAARGFAETQRVSAMKESQGTNH